MCGSGGASSCFLLAAAQCMRGGGGAGLHACSRRHARAPPARPSLQVPLPPVDDRKKVQEDVDKVRPSWPLAGGWCHVLQPLLWLHGATGVDTVWGALDGWQQGMHAHLWETCPGLRLPGSFGAPAWSHWAHRAPPPGPHASWLTPPVQAAATSHHQPYRTGFGAGSTVMRQNPTCPTCPPPLPLRTASTPSRRPLCAS